MRAPLSIIIPTLDAADELPQTLACLIEGLECGLVRELVVSDGGSTDATVQIAEAAGAVVVQGAKGRGGQLGRGADAAQGEWLLFLHADTHLSPGWADVANQHLEQSGRAAYFRLRFRADGFLPTLFAGWANFRSRLGLPYGDQGLLISRALFDQVGGYPDIALMEDVAIARALKGQLAMLGSQASTDARRYMKQGWFRRGSRNMWLLLRYRLGADPDDLARDYSTSSELEN